MGILQTYPHIFRALESNLGGHSNTALHHCKQEAMDRLTTMGMPTRKMERWRPKASLVQASNGNSICRGACLGSLR